MVNRATYENRDKPIAHTRAAAERKRENLEVWFGYIICGKRFTFARETFGMVALEVPSKIEGYHRQRYRTAAHQKRSLSSA